MESKELEQIIESLKTQISLLQALVASKDALILELQKQQITITNPMVYPNFPLQPLITCDHSFPWLGITPPSTCPKCGAALQQFAPPFIITSTSLLKDLSNG